MAEKSMSFDRLENIISVFGSFDENLHIIESETNVTITDRGSELKILGDIENIAYAEKAIEGLLALAGKGKNIDAQSVRYIIGLVRSGQEGRISELTKQLRQFLKKLAMIKFLNYQLKN